MMDLGPLAQIVAQLGIGAIFIWAWSTEREERRRAQDKLEKVQEEYSNRLERLLDFTPHFRPPNFPEN